MHQGRVVHIIVVVVVFIVARQLFEFHCCGSSKNEQVQENEFAVSDYKVFVGGIKDLTEEVIRRHFQQQAAEVSHHKP